MEPLVEAHDEAELERALGSDARLIGINNRDLNTLEASFDTADQLINVLATDVNPQQCFVIQMNRFALGRAGHARSRPRSCAVTASTPASSLTASASAPAVG